MALEIERRFLVPQLERVPLRAPGTQLLQGYLTRDGVTTRVRTAGIHAWLTLKGQAQGATRAEFEYAIPLTDARYLLHRLCIGERIAKRRYRIPVGRHVFEVDVFEGRYAPLAIAEVELSQPDEPVTLPPWVGQELTGDVRVSNHALAFASDDELCALKRALGLQQA